MIYSHEVQQMCCVKKGANHESAPIPEEGKWVRAKEIKDISGLTHGIGWCAPQQGACKLTLNVKDGIIEEALVETIGCSGMTHSAAMASEILPGKTILEALNTDLVCDAIIFPNRLLCVGTKSSMEPKNLCSINHIDQKHLTLMLIQRQNSNGFAIFIVEILTFLCVNSMENCALRKVTPDILAHSIAYLSDLAIHPRLLPPKRCANQSLMIHQLS